ncbi:MAG: M20/M25/M40 family metallo-hydrolase [Nitrososphaeria archaeon]
MEYGYPDMRVAKEEVLSRIDGGRLVKTLTELIDIPSPTGSEGEIGSYIYSKYRELGLKVIWQEVEDGRPNVIGILRGRGGGKSLQLDAHLDVSFTGTEEFLYGGVTSPKSRVEEREGDTWIFGAGAFNMKNAHAAYLEAVRAIVDSGIELEGDLILTATSGEIEESQVDDFRGKKYRGYGSGASYLAAHGPIGDYVIIGEPTGLKLMIGHYGSYWAKITASGGTVIHTAWSRGIPNKIEQMSEFIIEFREWKAKYEDKLSYKGYRGIVNIAAIQGGFPWKASRTPGEASIYVDIRFPPSMTWMQVRDDLDAFIADFNRRHPGYDIYELPYAINPPTEVDEGELVVRAVKDAHREVMGRDVETIYEIWYSNAPKYNSMGSKAINYGPGGAKKLSGLTLADKDREYISLSDLIAGTKVYALSALSICNTPR